MSEEPPLEEQIAKARKLRRALYAFFGILTLYVSVPMLVGALSGIATGDIYDPYTGEHLSTQKSDARWCFEEASRLMQQAGTMEKLNRRWEEPARQWTAKCRDSHPELHQALVETRRNLKSAAKKKR